MCFTLHWEGLRSGGGGGGGGGILCNVTYRLEISISYSATCVATHYLLHVPQDVIWAYRLFLLTSREWHGVY